MSEATKDIELSAEQSMQPRAAANPVMPSGVTGLLHALVGGNYKVSPWWSQQRDIDLANFWMSSDHLAGALGQLAAKVTTVPVRVLPRDNTVERHRKEAEQYTIMLNEESGFGAGWITELSKWLVDYWTTDNGAFFEITGAGDPNGPIEGPATGLAHLDSFRCIRTGDREYPVVYQSSDGLYHKYHYTRIAFQSDVPSAREEMFGVGYCAVSRVIANAQHLIDIYNYTQEKLGSRPPRGILIGKGISTEAILQSFQIASESMDSRDLGLFSQLVVLGDIPPDADLSMLGLSSLPDGFDQETSTRLGMFAIALAFGVPIRWLWPAATSGATKADAMYQHIAGLGGGIGKILQVLTMLLGGDPRGAYHGAGKFLPAHLKLVFDFQDDEQDRAQAEIKDTRAKTRNANLESGVYDIRTARVQAMDDGDLTQSEFNRLELEDGRLPSGLPVLGLFHSTKEPFFTWLDLGVDNPLAVSANNAMDMLAEINIAAINVQNDMANTSNVKRILEAQQALAALNQLKAMYAPLAQQSIQQSIMQRLRGNAPTNTEPEEPTTDEKAFEWGASVGEIIGGELARGEGGRFINIQEMMEAIQAGMLDRLGKSGVGGAQNSAADKRAGNRLAVAEALGLDPATLDTLALMKTGAATPEQEAALLASGLAKTNADGTISMTTSGRGLLSAANSGDVDKAEEARSKAGEQKPGKAPKAPKPSASERAAERAEAQAQEKRDNRNQVSESVSNRLPQASFNALMAFSEGQDPDVEQTTALAQAGLVEIDKDGNARFTSAGNAFVNAANKGDVRKAKDMLSKGSEQVAATQETVERLKVKAQEYKDKAEATRNAAQQEANELRDTIPQIREQAQERSAEYKAEAESLRTTAREYESTATSLTAESSSLDAEAAGLQDMIDNAPSPQSRQYYQEQQKSLQEQAKVKREQAQEARKAAQAALDRSAQYDERATSVLDDYEGHISTLQANIDKMLTAAEERAQGYEAAATDNGDNIAALLRSIGAGVAPSILSKVWNRVRRAIGRKVTGNPLPPVDEVEITDKDITAALEDWKTTAPKQAQGILEARAAGPLEMSVALESEEIDE